MIPTERREAIVKLVESKGVLSIPELADLLKVSAITVRRDLKEICSQGILQSVFGGVRSKNRSAIEPRRDYFENRAKPQKKAIALKASKIIPKNSCIYLDAGTTTYALAEFITDRSDLTIITNDFIITNLLMLQSKCKLIHTGGTVARGNSACVGDATSRSLLNYNIDIAFVSTPSWDARGITTSAEEKVSVKRSLMQCSQRMVLLVDSLKFGTTSTYLSLPIKAFDTIITDTGLSDEDRELVNTSGVSLIFAEIN